MVCVLFLWNHFCHGTHGFKDSFCLGTWSLYMPLSRSHFAHALQPYILYGGFFNIFGIIPGKPVEQPWTMTPVVLWIALIAQGRSCLLAITGTGAFLSISGSFKMAWSSSAASVILALSELSTTKSKPENIINLKLWHDIFLPQFLKRAKLCAWEIRSNCHLILL